MLKMKNLNYGLSSAFENAVQILTAREINEIAKTQRMKEGREGVDERRLLMSIESDLIAAILAEKREEVAHGLIEPLLGVRRRLRRVHEVQRLG